METALLNYFVQDDALHSACDFNMMFAENDVSIYEVVRVENAAPLFLEAHLKRFYESAQLEGRVIPVHPELVRQSLKTLIHENMLIFGNIKFLYKWDASGNQHFFVWVVPFFYPNKEQYKNGVFVDVMKAERPNPNSKRVLIGLIEKADEQIAKNKCFEVIYLNGKNEITEGSRSNIFFIQDRKLVTSELPSVLPGVTRAAIIELAHQSGITVVEKKIQLTDLGDFSSCFLSGTSPKILPVVKLHDHIFDVENSVMNFLMDAYNKLCNIEKKEFHW